MGTELQQRGVPVDDPTWSAAALANHPDIVRQVHKEYAEAGAEVHITNTFAAARHILDLAGLGNRTRELNTKAVQLVREAIEHASPEGLSYVAGSMSAFLLAGRFRALIAVPLTEVRANFREQAETLAEAGADLLVVEMMQDTVFAPLCIEAAVSTGLPVWVGFSTAIGADGTTVELCRGEVGHTFADDLKGLMSIGGDLAAIMHTTSQDTAPSLDVLKQHWQGPMGAYPHASDEAARGDLTDVPGTMEFMDSAQDWVSRGAQVIGSCCGFGPEYIRALKQRLLSTAS